MLKEKAILELMNNLIECSVQNKNNLPFCRFEEGGKIENTFHKTTIHWNNQFIEVRADVLSDTITLSQEDNVLFTIHKSISFLEKKISIDSLLNTLFP